MAAKSGAKVPAWLTRAYDGLDDDVETRRIVAAAVLAEQVQELRARGFDQFHFYTLNQANLTYAACRILGACRREGFVMSFDRAARIQWMKEEAKKRILLLDGSWGVLIQSYKLGEDDFRGDRFGNHGHELKGNNDLLTLTRPGHHPRDRPPVSRRRRRLSRDQHLHLDRDLAGRLRPGTSGRRTERDGARLAREICDAASTSTRPRLVAGVLGPTNRSAGISPDVNDPAFRNITFDELRATYRKEATLGLIRGGSDVLMIETIFDTLNAKAAIFAIEEAFDELGERLPIWISGTITDLSGRTLTGQTPEAFWHSVRHAKPFAVGLNCALGAKELRPYVDELSTVADTLVSAHPNAGLPNEFGGYDETPENMAR